MMSVSSTGAGVRRFYIDVVLTDSAACTCNAPVRDPIYAKPRRTLRPAPRQIFQASYDVQAPGHIRHYAAFASLRA